MKREIKFRVWSQEKSKFASDRTGFTLQELGPIFPLWFDKDRTEYIFQQYIGVKDISNNEIFEGDIIQNQSGRKFLVEFVFRGFEYREILTDVHGKEELQPCSVNFIGDEKLAKVVGNILENSLKI